MQDNTYATTLLQVQQQLGGTTSTDAFPAIADFGDWTREYRAATHGTAIFDLSTLDAVAAGGKDSLDLLHRLSMNEIRQMQPGEIVVNAFPNAKGRIVDAVLQLRREQHFELFTAPGRQQLLQDWIDRYVFVEDVTLENITGRYGCFLLCGPQAPGLFAAAPPAFRLAADKAAGIDFEAAGVDGLLPPGILILAPIRDAAGLYRYFVEDKDCQPAGNRAFHALRVASGVPFAGNEISEAVNPYEAGLAAAINYTKGCYIGQEVIARLDTYDKVKMVYTRLRLDGEAVPPVPAPVMHGDSEVGEVTSAALVPEGDGYVAALARIRRKAHNETQVFSVSWNGNKARATVETTPAS